MMLELNSPQVKITDPFWSPRLLINAQGAHRQRFKEAVA
jgi:hypothetical protein